MSSMNVRVYFADTGSPKRDAVEHKNVKITFEQGWALIEDQYCEIVAYPSATVSWIVAKPTSYDRGSW